MTRDFVWNGGSYKRGSNLVKWEWTALPPNHGGLGIGSLAHRNSSLMTKWLWRFSQEKYALWRKIIVSIYGVSTNGWMSKDFKGKKGNRIWVDIAANYPMFQKHIKFSVSNGSNIRFWEDIWCVDQPLHDKFPDLYLLSRKKDCMVADCWDSRQQTWDLAFRRNLFD